MDLTRLHVTKLMIFRGRERKKEKKNEPKINRFDRSVCYVH